MTESSSKASPSESSGSGPSTFDFDQFIQEAQQKLNTLKQRRQAVSAGQSNHQRLKQKKVDAETLKDIKASQEIEADLEKLEYELANELIEMVGEENLTWKGTGESFWIFFRYAGIGFAIAVILHQLIK